MLTPDQAKTRWRGVVAPLVTPFTARGDVDLDALRANVQWLLDRGARQGNTVLLAAGSGGDFSVMTLEERKAVIRTIAEVAAGHLPIIAGAQSLDVRDCIALCQLCEDLGIDAVQISGPFYYGGHPGDVVAWMEELARHTQVGFALYNNWYTGYDMPLDLIEKLVEIPNVVGLKWSSPDIEVFQAGVRRFASRLAVVNNTFVSILGHMLGCPAFISHFPNFYPEFCWQVWDLMEEHAYSEAQTLFDRVMTPYRELIAPIMRQTAGEAVFVRPAMAAVGLNGGHSRLPSRDTVVTPEMREGFRRFLSAVGAR
jgi:dihydrodipicolinate synthase/N-acetylneuraminate lyase